MVDFQSRETSRGVGTDDAEDGGTDEAEPDEVVDAAGDEVAEGKDHTATVEDSSTTATAEGAVSVAILLTDDRSDAAADAVADALDGEHEVLGRDQRTGDLDAIQTAVDTFLDQSAVDAVVTVGGVGVGLTQVTVDAVEPLLDARLPGFGELFRRRYEAQVGSGAVQTRAFGGIAGSTPVFCLPADPEATRVATEELLVPELGDIVAAAGEP